MNEATIQQHPQHRYDYYAIIPHREEPRILMLPGWTLPRFTPVEHHFGVVGHINRAMRAQFGIRVMTLRCVYEKTEVEARRTVRVYALDNLSPNWTPPPGAAWLAYTQLDTVSLTDPQHRAALYMYFDWLEQDSPLRVPWSRRGWFDDAANWIYGELERHGLTAIGPIEQVRSWVRSSTLFVPTTGGNCYFKAVPKMFAYEPVLTRVLAQRHPGYIPDVLSVNVERAWMLMRDVGGEPLSDQHDIEVWEAALRYFAQIQIDMVSQAGTLIGIGCPDRHVDELAFQIERLFSDRASMLSGDITGLAEDEATELMTYAQDLEDMCYTLVEYDVPLSLEHGDLWAGNIIVSGERTIFFDWSDSSVTHPFFDMLFFIANIETALQHVSDAKERLITAYLEPWTDYAPLDELREAMEVAQPVAALHHALIYHAVILPSIEPQAKWEMAHMLPFYLRKLLELMRQRRERDS